MNPGEPQEPEGRLKALWTLEQPPGGIAVEDLHAEVARRRRRMVWIVAGEVLLTVGLVVLTVHLLGANRPASPRLLTWLGALWLTWLITAGFATWNRWGVWRPSGETAWSYLALSEERARRRRRVATFVLGLVSVQFVLVLIFGEVRAVGLATVTLYAGWAAWYRWKTGRELRAIRRISREFRGGSPPM